MEYKLVKQSEGELREYDGVRYTVKIVSENIIVILAELSPGAETEEYSHDGEEFRIVIEGEIECELDGRIFKLKAGDSIWHVSRRKHRIRNVGSKTARYITVGTPPTFGRI